MGGIAPTDSPCRSRHICKSLLSGLIGALGKGGVAGEQALGATKVNNRRESDVSCQKNANFAS